MLPDKVLQWVSTLKVKKIPQTREVPFLDLNMNFQGALSVMRKICPGLIFSRELTKVS